MKVTLQRFGRNRRLVLMLEWLTLWPVWGPLAVSSQRRDICQILFHPLNALSSKLCLKDWPALSKGAAGVKNRVPTGSGGRIGGNGTFVKVLSQWGDPRASAFS